MNVEDRRAVGLLNDCSLCNCKRLRQYFENIADKTEMRTISLLTTSSLNKLFSSDHRPIIRYD